MESEESNYLASLLPLTVISDAMKLAKNLQIDGFIQKTKLHWQKPHNAICPCTIHVVCRNEL